MEDLNYPNARDCQHGQLRRSCPHCEYDRDMAEADQTIQQLKTKLAESDARVVKYDELLLQVENKHPNESRHETALRYIRQAENKSHQSCGAGKSEH